LAAELPVSYEATDPPLPSEEDDEGNIVPSAALDGPGDEDESAFGDSEDAVEQLDERL